MKTLSVLNPFSSISADVIGDCDLAGPLMFCMALGSFLLLVSTTKEAFFCLCRRPLLHRLARYTLGTFMALGLVDVWLFTLF